MFTQSQLNEILQKISLKSKEIFGSSLDSVILFGSYARGDYDEESDTMWQQAAGEDAYCLHRGSQIWIECEDPIPETAEEISVEEAERIEDKWNEELEQLAEEE